MVLPALREKTLQNLRKKTTKNFECSLAKSEREREKVEKLLKKMFETVKELFFFKNLKHDVDWSKNRFDQSNQAEAHLNF